MLMPSIFGENLFDDWMDFPFDRNFFEGRDPELKNGYMTISAAKGLDKDEKDKEGRYIRKERYSGSCSRSFYVGEQISEEDIKARFEDGILKISFPKRDQKKMEENRYIAIEG